MQITCCWIVGFFSLTLLAPSAIAQAPCGALAPGYHIRQADTIIQLARALYDTSTAFHVLVKRTFDTEREERLLRLAEAVYPARDVVTAALRRRPQWTDPDSTRASLWWQGTFDGVRIVYAITADAVQYYLDLTRAYRAGDFAAARTIPMLQTNFEYVAHIQRFPIFDVNGWLFEDVYVVRMRLAWRDYCGTLCALSLTKERTVVLNEDGDILGVFGDGPTLFMVS